MDWNDAVEQDLARQPCWMLLRRTLMLDHSSPWEFGTISLNFKIVRGQPTLRLAVAMAHPASQSACARRTSTHRT